MNSQQYMEIAHGRTILERIRNAREARQKAADGAASSRAMSAIDVLRAIIEEVGGISQPFSTDSHLPAHLIHDARQVIEAHEREHALINAQALKLRISAEEAK